jgi:hypothetical protein
LPDENTFFLRDVCLVNDEQINTAFLNFKTGEGKKMTVLSLADHDFRGMRYEN